MPPHHASLRLPHVTLFRCVVLVAAFVVAGVPALRLAAALPAARSFDLPADAGDKSLSRFALQAGVEVIFGSATAAQVRTTAVKGTYLPQEALGLLLSRTGLVATQDEKTGAITVSRDPKAQGAAPKTANSDRPDNNEKRTTPSTAEVMSVSREGNIVELNPFVVTSDQEVGYLATNTLAGTRLNTDLKDIGAAVSVYTEEFLNDINAQRVEDILTYTASTEGGGIDGNYSGMTAGSSDEVRDNPSGVVRVRSLAEATRTRDYFASDIPADTYNFGTLTISRGPNAVLAGTGSAGGIVDAALRQATFNNSNQVVFRIGEYGSHRQELHLNRVLLKNRLALHVDLLNANQGFQQEPSYQKDKRVFLAATLKLRDPKTDALLGRTTVRANVEFGSIEGVPPNQLSPVLSIESWFDNANPAFNKWRFNGATQTMYNSAGGVIPPTSVVVGFPMYQNWALIYANPASGQARVGFSDPDLAAVQGFMGNLPGGIQGPGGVMRATGDPNRTKQGFYRTRLMDRNVFDFYNHLLTGVFDYREQKFDATDIRLEQLLLGGKAGFEIAYNNQTFERKRDFPITGDEDTTFIDTNQFLTIRSTAYPNGIPNPNFGRPFIVTRDAFRDQVNRSERESLQATAFIRHDFTKVDSKLGRLLGRHSFSGLLYKTTVSRFNRAYESTWDPTGQLNPLTSLGTAPGTFGTQVNAWFYLGESVLNAASKEDVRLQPITTGRPQYGQTYTLRAYDQATKSFVTGTSTPMRVLRSLRNQEEEVRSGALTLQSHWLGGHVTTLAGWRKDESEASTSADLPRLPGGDLDLSKYALRSASAQAQASWTKSVVARVPERLMGKLPFNSELRVYWNDSENFSPVGQRRNAWNEEVGSPSASTREYGVMLSLFRGKLDLRVNRYKTQIQNDAVTGVGNPYSFIDTTITRMVSAHNQGLRPANYGYTYAGFTTFEDVARAFYATIPERLKKNIGPGANFNPHFVGTGSSLAWEPDSITNLASLSDTVSTGTEFEVVLNPTRSWRIAVNAAKNEAVKANVAREELAFAAAWGKNLESMYDGNLLKGWRLPPTEANTIWPSYQAATLGALQVQNALSGTRTSEIRKWRANLVSSYDFREGFLNGFRVGGSMRWQDKIGTGYPYILDAQGNSVADIAHPFWGPEELQVDLAFGYRRKFKTFGTPIDWSIGLNIRNLIANDHFIPIKSNPDGTYGTFRIPPNRAWSITNSFRF